MSKRMKRIDRTLEEYMLLGAYYTILKDIVVKTDVIAGNLCGWKLSDYMFRATKIINKACSDAEDCMFRDYPMLEPDYVKVFYGGMNGNRTTPVEKRERQMIKEILQGMIERLDKDD